MNTYPTERTTTRQRTLLILALSLAAWVLLSAFTALPAQPAAANQPPPPPDYPAYGDGYYWYYAPPVWAYDAGYYYGNPGWYRTNRGRIYYYYNNSPRFVATRVSSNGVYYTGNGYYYPANGTYYTNYPYSGKVPYFYCGSYSYADKCYNRFKKDQTTYRQAWKRTICDDYGCWKIRNWRGRVSER
jgi:hypothetical protein